MSEELVPLFITNLAGTEDITHGYETEQQVRDGEIVAISQLNAHNIKYIKKAPPASGVATTIGEALDILLDNGGQP